MSKSLGNFFTVREILAKYDPEVVRFFILRAHYRSPLNYSDAHLDEAKNALTRLYTALNQSPFPAGTVDWNEAHAKRFKEAMDDDFGTPEAIAELHQLANEVFQGSAAAARQLKALGGVLGLLQRDPDDFLKGRLSLKGESATGRMLGEEHIKQRIERRVEARKRKDFKEADRIRDELAKDGIVLEDKGGITTWRRV
jgi:cysteinyl-tRNA synthetase